MMKKLFLAVLAMASLVVMACGGAGGGSDLGPTQDVRHTVTVKPPDSITVAPVLVAKNGVTYIAGVFSPDADSYVDVPEADIVSVGWAGVCTMYYTNPVTAPYNTTGNTTITGIPAVDEGEIAYLDKNGKWYVVKADKETVDAINGPAEIMPNGMIRYGVAATAAITCQ